MKSSLLLGALVSALVACDAPPTSTDAADPAENAEVAEPTDGASRGKPGTRPSVQERLVEKNVRWPAASAIDAPARARFVTADAEKVDLSGVPVMAPARGLEARGAEGRADAPFAKATVVTRPDWFTLALKDADFEQQRLAGRAPGARGAGLSVFVQGHRTARRLADVPPTLGRHTVRGRPAWITQNEGVWSATWEEHGATYAVDLECGDPEDARCANDAVLRDVAESLVFVGGDLGAPRSSSKQGGGAK
jgi:hypothetical protein